MSGQDKQAGSVSQQASFLWIYTMKCQLKKGKTKQNAASLQSFQLLFEVIMLAGLDPPVV
jgi:hypothetical protein